VRGTLDEVEKRYKGQVKLVYRHLPLSQIHANAMPAAIASECAAEQGRFWPYHDLVFDNRPQLSEEMLLSLAPKAGVRNLEKFKACTTSTRFRSRVQEDMEAADALGITGTPGFFIGTMADDGLLEGEVMTGAQPVEAFVTMIEAVRARMKK